MAIPILVALGGALSVGAGVWARRAGWAWAAAAFADAIKEICESDTVAGIITDGVNAAIAEALKNQTVSLAFSDITDKEAIKAELMAFAVSLINDKIGADFSDVDWDTVTKDEILLRLSRVIRDRINVEAQAQLGDIWPVETAKQSIEDEVVRQIVAYLEGPPIEGGE